MLDPDLFFMLECEPGLDKISFQQSRLLKPKSKTTRSGQRVFDKVSKPGGEITVTGRNENKTENLNNGRSPERDSQTGYLCQERRILDSVFDCS